MDQDGRIPARALGRVLVIGAGGFIGRHVVAALNRRRPDSARAGYRRGIPDGGIYCDLMDPDSLRAAMRGVDTVINCAHSPGGMENARASARNLAGAAASCGVGRLIHMSSIAVYAPPNGVVHEESPLTSAVHGYGPEKIAAEDILRQASSCDLRVVILRPGLVYGCGEAQFFECFVTRGRLDTLRDLGAFGVGDANLVHVEDLAAFCATLVDSDVPELAVANVVGDQVPNWNSYFAAIASAAGKAPPPPRTMPRMPWEARRFMRRVVRKLIGKLPIRSARESLPGGPVDAPFEGYTARLRLATDRARALGFMPRFDVEAGVRQAMDQLRGHHEIR